VGPQLGRREILQRTLSAKQNKASVKEIVLIFPHQLFDDHPAIQDGRLLILIEEHLFFREFKFHRSKLALHRASMKYYAQNLKEQGLDVEYIPSTDEASDIRTFLAGIDTQAIGKLHLLDPTDNWLEKRIREGLASREVELVWYENPSFHNDREQLKSFFRPGKKKFFHASWYKEQRRIRNILLNDGEPVGGRWSYDDENRKKYPKAKTAPFVRHPEPHHIWEEAASYVNEHFSNNPGALGSRPIFPYTRKEALQWFEDFLLWRFAEFGPYEDAIVREEIFLNHSAISPMMNIGLLTQDELIQRSLQFSDEHDIPLPSLEGFVRQVIGWREFIRGMYEVAGSQQRTANFWGFERHMPKAFYEANTGIDPVDDTIRKVLQTGYCHHIERLMVIGNFMLLCEIHPDEVYRWFMELFVDAYDWVMVPNLYGMSQHADGGLMTTKPYISSSNYILKMSNHKKGPWQEIWDALFWRFMHLHRDYLGTNPRIRMLLSNFDRKPPEEKAALLDRAERYLDSLAW
jgi:deoxyribodipyrimidine photolyase-related protein